MFYYFLIGFNFMIQLFEEALVFKSGLWVFDFICYCSWKDILKVYIVW